MNTFITKFNTFQALAKYPEDWLIELLEQNADQQIIKRLILEKGHYMLVVDFKKDLKQAGSRKQLLNQEWQKGPRQRTLMPWILMPPRAATQVFQLRQRALCQRMQKTKAAVQRVQVPQQQS